MVLVYIKISVKLKRKWSLLCWLERANIRKFDGCEMLVEIKKENVPIFVWVGRVTDLCGQLKFMSTRKQIRWGWKGWMLVGVLILGSDEVVWFWMLQESRLKIFSRGLGANWLLYFHWPFCSRVFGRIGSKNL